MDGTDRGDDQAEDDGGEHPHHQRDPDREGRRRPTGGCLARVRADHVGQRERDQRGRGDPRRPDDGDGRGEGGVVRGREQVGHDQGDRVAEQPDEAPGGGEQGRGPAGGASVAGSRRVVVREPAQDRSGGARRGRGGQQRGGGRRERGRGVVVLPRRGRGHDAPGSAVGPMAAPRSAGPTPTAVGPPSSSWRLASRTWGSRRADAPEHGEGVDLVAAAQQDHDLPRALRPGPLLHPHRHLVGEAQRGRGVPGPVVGEVRDGRHVRPRPAPRRRAVHRGAVGGREVGVLGAGPAEGPHLGEHRPGQQLGRAVPAEAGGPVAARLRDLAGTGGVGQLGERARQRGGEVVDAVDEPAGDPVEDRVADAGRAQRQARHARGGTLEDDQAPALAVGGRRGQPRRVHERVALGVGQPAVEADHPPEAELDGGAAQGGQLRAVADDLDLQVGDVGQRGPDRVQQEVDALVRDEPAGQHDRGALGAGGRGPGAAGRRHAVGDDVDRAVELEAAAQLLTGGRRDRDGPLAGVDAARDPALEEPADGRPGRGEPRRELVLVDVVDHLHRRDRVAGEDRREERDAVLAVDDRVELRAQAAAQQAQRGPRVDRHRGAGAADHDAVDLVVGALARVASGQPRHVDARLDPALRRSRGRRARRPRPASAGRRAS